MRCVALFSGGLDSQLAVRLMTLQKIDVHALHIRTPFECCQHQVAQVAQRLNVPLTVLAPEPKFFELIRDPRFGYGRGANPCVDCRIYMFQRAAAWMRQVEAEFVVSGEVLGQRPMSQKRTDLEIISYHSGLHERLLRPLSAKRLPTTIPEKEGWVDPDLLYDFWGRGRKGLIALAKQLGFDEIPMPSTGCALTERAFSRKVFDLLLHQSGPSPWDFELLKYGRHFRYSDQCKIVVGRRETENKYLEYLAQQPAASSSAVLTPDGFQGPAALVIGPPTDQNLRYAAQLVLRYAKVDDHAVYQLHVSFDTTTQKLEMSADRQINHARTLAMSPR